MFAVLGIVLAVIGAAVIWTSGRYTNLAVKLLVGLLLPIVLLILGLAFAALDQYRMGETPQYVVFGLIMGSFIIKYVIIDLIVDGVKSIKESINNRPRWSRMKQIDQELTLELEDGTTVNGYFDAMLKDDRLAVSLSGAENADWKLVKGTCTTDDIDSVIEDLKRRANEDKRDEAGNTVPLTV